MYPLREELVDVTGSQRMAGPVTGSAAVQTRLRLVTRVGTALRISPLLKQHSHLSIARLVVGNALKKKIKLSVYYIRINQ